MGSKWNSNILATLLKLNTQENKDRVEKQKQAYERMRHGADAILKHFEKKENQKK